MSDAAGKWQAFGEADAALIASGTVSLELALAGVPLVSCYKLDPFARMVQGLITVWSALLPNLIADRPVAPEFYNRLSCGRRSGAASSKRCLPTPRCAPGRSKVLPKCSGRMATERPSGEIAAEVVMRYVK